jgi:heme oxygenase (biliverdin-IX-beta and delta-forming)
MAFDELKRGTQDLHTRVEQAVDMASVCAGLPSYRALLSRLLGYYEPIEDQLSRVAWDSVGFDFDTRRKSAWLRHDLAFLGITDTAQAELPRCTQLPPTTSMATALGVMYVLEGATLGGQVILRMIDKNLQLSAHRGAGFHSGYGPHNGSMWLSFKSAATRQLDSSARIDEAVHTARETFLTYETWLLCAAQALACELPMQHQPHQEPHYQPQHQAPRP